MTGGGLATLIRLRSWDCEERRRAVDAAQARVDDLASRLRDLVAARERERAAVAALPFEAKLGLGVYERRMRVDCASLAAELQAAAAALAEARARLAEAYREKRKLELAEGKRLRAEAMAHARRERIALDEIALRGATSGDWRARSARP